MIKIIYIAGLGHSGSTILDLSLGCNPNIVGLGEVVKILEANKEDFNRDEFNKIQCSCGHDLNSCAFWSGMKQLLFNRPFDNVISKYNALISYFQQRYTSEMVLVDSSKGIYDFLDILDQQYDLYVIFLIKDFRGWAYSRHSRLGKNVLYLSYKWLKDNLAMLKRLDKKKLKYIKIGYEELALYPDFMLTKICEFVGIEYTPSMLNPDKSSSHIIRGNVLRGDSVKRKMFYYDARWMTSESLLLLSPLMLPIIKWNKNNVYSNFLIGGSQAFGRTQKDFLIFGDREKEQIEKRVKNK